MTALFATIATTLCGSILTLILFVLYIFIQNLPTIVMATKEILRGLIEFSIKTYRLILQNLIPSLVKYLPYRIFASVVISLLLCGILTYWFYGKLIFWPFIFAVLHGLAVGLGWEISAKDTLYLGDDL